MTVAVDSAGRTHQGLVRTQNEDHFVVATMRKAIDIVDTSLDASALQERMTPGKAYLFAVADGVGGRPGGELASEATVETLLRFVAQAAGCYHGLRAEGGSESVGTAATRGVVTATLGVLLADVVLVRVIQLLHG